jgi:hypothetical protein
VLYVTHNPDEVRFWSGPTWELRAAESEALAKEPAPAPEIVAVRVA